MKGNRALAVLFVTFVCFSQFYVGKGDPNVQSAKCLSNAPGLAKKCTNTTTTDSIDSTGPTVSTTVQSVSTLTISITASPTVTSVQTASSTVTSVQTASSTVLSVQTASPTVTSVQTAFSTVTSVQNTAPSVTSVLSTSLAPSSTPPAGAHSSNTTNSSGTIDCDSTSCLEPNCQNETDGSCKCNLGYSGVNCTDVCANSKCGTEENCKANSFSTLGYECIPKECSSVNCTGNTTCAKNGTSGYACLENECLSDSYCHRGNGKCDFSPQTGNSSCECSLGYDDNYGCKLVLSCSTNTTDPMLSCQNGALCVPKDNNGVDNGFKECNCTGGFTGTRCQDHTCDVDSPCGRRGECSPSNSTPFYSCDCSQGYTGPTCDQSDPCSLNPCLNNGTCSDAGSDGFECSCTPGWDPETNCSLRINHCEPNPCENGGTCADRVEDFSCTCTKGFKGTNCSRDLCLSCQHGGGTCLRNDTFYHCQCPEGLGGSQCELPLCRLDTCFNGGVCSDLRGEEAFSCACPSWAEGQRCERLANPSILGISIPNATVCTAACRRTRGDGQCQSECNVEVCGNDGGDCPVRDLCSVRTAEGVLCRDVFKNGVCNPNCNVANCLFDGLDCRQDLPVCLNKSCVSEFGNGMCNSECNTGACVFDGGDCATRPKKLLRGLLFVEIVATLEDFKQNSNKFLLSIGEVLNCIPVLGEVEEFPGIDRRQKRDGHNDTRVRAYLGLDVSQCNSSVESCLTTVEEGSDILNNLKTERQYQPAGYTITNTGTDSPTSPPPEGPFPLGAIGGIAVGVLLIGVVLVVAGVLLKRKRTVKAAIWRPEGTNPTPRSDSFDDDSPSSKRERIVPGKERSSKDLHSDTDGYPMKSVGEKGACGWEEAHLEMETGINGFPPSKVVIGEQQRENPSWTALHYRALHQPSLVQEFAAKFNEETDNSADVNVRGPGGCTTLMVAVMLGNVQGEGEEEGECDMGRGKVYLGSEAASPPRMLTVKDLLRMGASSNLKNELGQTALHIAASSSRADVTRLLLSYRADPNTQDLNGRSPLHVAIVSEADGVFQILLRHKATNPDLDAEDGTTPLILATQHHAVSMVDQLLREVHVDANTQDKSGKTALHWAASMNMMEIMKILLKQGANKDSQDNHGQTPLFLAAKEGSSDAVRLLLESQANRNIQDNMERTPLRIAELRFHKDIVHLLTDTYYSHLNDTSSHHHHHHHPNVRMHGGGVCQGVGGMARAEYDYLNEALPVPPPPYHNNLPYRSSVYPGGRDLTAASHCRLSGQPDGAEVPGNNSSPHSVDSGVICTPNGLPACLYEPSVTSTAGQYPLDTLLPSEHQSHSMVVSPMSNYSPPYTGDHLPQDLQATGRIPVGTTSPEMFSNPNIDPNIHFYPSPPESNKSPCSYDGMQIPTPPSSDGQIESPPMASCMQFDPSISFPANQAVYSAQHQQLPPVQY